MWRYCDAGFHSACYEAWPHRKRFSRLKADTHIRHERSDPYWHLVFSNDDVFVTIGSAMSPPTVDVALLNVDACLRVPLAEWESWLQNEVDPKEWRPQTLAALQSVRPVLRQHLPDVPSIWDALSRDRPDKALEVERRQAEKRVRDAQCAAEVQQEREAYELLVSRMRTRGLSCPWCTASVSTDFRVVLAHGFGSRPLKITQCNDALSYFGDMPPAFRLFALFCLCLLSTGSAEAAVRKRKHSTRTKIHAHCMAGQTRFDLIVSKPDGPDEDLDTDTLWIRQHSKRAVALKTELEVPKQPKPSAGSICDALTVIDVGSGQVLIGLVVDERPSWDATLVLLYDLASSRLQDTQEIPSAEQMVSLGERVLAIQQHDSGEGSACDPQSFGDAGWPKGVVDCASVTLGVEVLVRGEAGKIRRQDDLARTWAARTDLHPFFSGPPDFAKYFGFDEAKGFTQKGYVGIWVDRTPRCIRRRDSSEWNCAKP